MRDVSDVPVRQRAAARFTELLAALGTAVTLLTAIPPQTTSDSTARCTNPYFHLGGVFHCEAPVSPNGESCYAFPDGAQQLIGIGTNHTAWSSRALLRSSGWSAVYIRASPYNPTLLMCADLSAGGGPPDAG